MDMMEAISEVLAKPVMVVAGNEPLGAGAVYSARGTVSEYVLEVVVGDHVIATSPSVFPPV